MKYETQWDRIAQRLVDGPTPRDPQRLTAHVVAEVSGALLQAFGDGMHQGRIEGRERAWDALGHALQTFSRDLERHRAMVKEIKEGTS